MNIVKKILPLLLALLLIAGCNTDKPDSSATDNPSTPDSSSDPVSQPENPVAELTPEQLNEIMCIFGAELKVTYNEQGEPVESDTVEYQTEVISFYYDEEGYTSAADITPYGFYGWFNAYDNHNLDAIKALYPDYEGAVVVKNDNVSGEIYGQPAKPYEDIVTAFFDVDIEALRGEDLYDAEVDAYVPNGGPGIGERPNVHVESHTQEGDIVTLNIVVEGTAASPAKTMALTVRLDESNTLGGIKFVSLLPVTEG